MSPSHRHDHQPPARLDHFTDCGEPLTVVAGVVLERAMVGPHPTTMDATYLEQQVERCRADHLARIGSPTTRAEVIAATREAVALGSIHPSKTSEDFAAALSGLEP